MRITPLRSALAAAALAAGITLFGCSLYRNDHCWVSDEQYAVAREIFVQTGSLDLVKQRLVALQWQRCAQNEAIYRLQKEFEVLPEVVPNLGAQPQPSRVPAISIAPAAPTATR
ncbi:hypothetical protein LLG95_18555 [bacterium]|nr:hypothetical protein [bacterium]